MSAFKTFERAAGVLLNVSSLPGEFGIGCLSRDADAYVDLIADMGFGWWQTLPVTEIGADNSPYSGQCSFAGNRLYICPTELEKVGLLSADEAAACKYRGEPYLADYDFARLNCERYLRLAYGRINGAMRAEMDKFRARESEWIEDHALFRALAAEYSPCWWKWQAPIKERDEEAINKAREQFAEEIDFAVFEQYEFFREWSALRERARRRGVRVIGELPFYVPTDSADVWARQELFQLDGNGFPRAIAGAPPDAFSRTGQVWGNCLYDFAAMKKDGYRWWLGRIGRALELYDAVKLDHFRGYYNYYAIPAADFRRAEQGHWEDGPREELLGAILQKYPEALFIADDLGVTDEKCRAFIDGTGLARMRVFQYGFDGTPSMHMPFRYGADVVAYTGTHDNNTTLGWLYELNEGERNAALKYCGAEGAGWGAGGPECRSVRAIIRTLMMSAAAMVVLPFQDMLGYGGDTRMNGAMSSEGNWKWRLPYHLMTTVDRNFFLDLISTYGRRYGGGI